MFFIASLNSGCTAPNFIFPAESSYQNVLALNTSTNNLIVSFGDSERKKKGISSFFPLPLGSLSLNAVSTLYNSSVVSGSFKFNFFSQSFLIKYPVDGIELK